MSKLATAIAGTLATGAVAGGAIIGYQQLSNSNNSDTNGNVSVQQANTNNKPTRSIKNELLGTWVQTFATNDPDQPKNKIEFTADEVITHKEVVTYTDEEVPQKKTHTETDKGNYNIFCGQFLELKDGKSDAVFISKFTIEGDELTIAGKTKDRDRKFKRESSNTAANTSTETADSNTEGATLNQKDLVGTWIDTEKAEFKYVFTQDQVTAYGNGEEEVKQTYKLPCGQILESTDERGSILFAKVTIEGTEMTVYRNGEKYKWKRESADGDRIAQEKTMSDIGIIATALSSWFTDNLTDNISPQDLKRVTASADMKNYVRISYEDMKKELSPTDTFFYIRYVPEKDGWGHPYEFYLNKKKLGSREKFDGVNVMAIRSPGRDGKFQDSTIYQVGSFPADSFDEDLVWTDLDLIRWAEKRPEN